MAIAIFVFNVIARKTMIGSIFKYYYKLVIVASAALVLSFVVELPIIPLNEIIAELLHHILFITFAILSVVAAQYLPKEAAKYMEKH